MMKNCKFLLVDDNHIDRMVASMVLQQSLQDVDISEAVDGLEALNCLKNYGEDPPSSLVILLDIRMPEMDGFEFLEEYDRLQIRWKADIEIVMLSSSVDPRDLQRATNNKYVKGILSKPLPFDELSNLLAS